MDYVITFSDVMAGVITLGLGVITFFIKGWFNNLKSSTEDIKKQIKENDDKVNKMCIRDRAHRQEYDTSGACCFAWMQ